MTGLNDTPQSVRSMLEAMKQNLQEANIELVRSMSQSFVAGRLDQVQPHIAPDMVMHLPAGLPYGGSYIGWSGYLAVATAIGNYFSDIDFAPPQYVAGGDRVIVMTHLKATTRNGDVVDMPLTEIWEILGGIVHRITAFYFDTKAI
jgi:ketosteroid isomerase-like protein